MSNQFYDANIVVLGAADCGKTDFINSLLAGLKAVRVDDTTYRLQRQDRIMRIHILENDLVEYQRSELISCALLCYDTTSRDTLAAVQQYWHSQLMLMKPANVDSLPMMLLGLKCDLQASSRDNAVDTALAVKHGQEMRTSYFGICSAKSGQFMKLVAEDFLAMLKECIAKQYQDDYSYCVIL